MGITLPPQVPGRRVPGDLQDPENHRKHQEGAGPGLECLAPLQLARHPPSRPRRVQGGC